MFRLASAAASRLSPEAVNVSELFLRALPPFARARIRQVRLFGPQARAFDVEAPFAFLVVVDDRSIETKTAIAIATTAAEADGMHDVQVTIATAAEASAGTASISRALLNARREGVDVWQRDPANA